MNSLRPNRRRHPPPSVSWTRLAPKSGAKRVLDMLGAEELRQACPGHAWWRASLAPPLADLHFRVSCLVQVCLTLAVRGDCVDGFGIQFAQKVSKLVWRSLLDHHTK
jgi:hypothetical protein